MSEPEVDLFREWLPGQPVQDESVLFDLQPNEEPEDVQDGAEPGDGNDFTAKDSKKDAMSKLLYGTNLFGDSAEPVAAGPLAERFTFPPFSVLSARDGSWQARKRAWVAVGIRGEEGRGDNQTGIPGGAAMPAADYSTRERGDGTGRSASSKFGKCLETGIGDKYGRKEMNATSIFDPVLCELAYTWFCPKGGQVVDPFAGGSVRGIVAGLLGFQYWGCDLRAEQIEANRVQHDEIMGPCLPGLEDAAELVRWVCGDSRVTLASAPCADFVFSCPPYGDLEVYSNDANDISSMGYEEFLQAYREIIASCASKLKPNRMACFVVGDFRDKKTGNYRGFVADTINAFRDAGLPLYNDAILVTSVGSLPVRVSGQFEASRKLGKTHQNVLCFAKGDPRKAFEEA